MPECKLVSARSLIDQTGEANLLSILNLAQTYLPKLMPENAVLPVLSAVA